MSNSGHRPTGKYSGKKLTILTGSNVSPICSTEVPGTAHKPTCDHDMVLEVIARSAGHAQERDSWVESRPLQVWRKGGAMAGATSVSDGLGTYHLATSFGRGNHC